MPGHVYRSPEQLLAELGIDRPEDIDVEVIAFSCGATIDYEPLVGCEAHIIGRGNEAIITVNSSSSRERQRFSAAHELGHWMRDRGTVAFACDERKIRDDPVRRREDPEHLANLYAAGLLLPQRMFDPLAKGQEITFTTVERLSQRLQTSLTATAIRLVRNGSFPSILVRKQPGGREWWIADPDVPIRDLKLRDQPGADSIARELLAGDITSSAARDVCADAWFEHDRADRFRIYEDSRKVSGGVLTLLWWKDEAQLRELEEDDDRQPTL